MKDGRVYEGKNERMKASELLAVALAESGYIGKKTNAQLDDPAANPGGKFTKYARDLADAGYYNGNKNGFNYCAVFVDWCFYVAAGRNKETAFAVKPVNEYGASVRFIRCMFPEDRIFPTCAAGDQVIFQDSAGVLTHTGLVASVTGNSFKTIEGNITNKYAVGTRSFAIDDPSVYCFVRPYYDPEIATITIPETEYNKLVSDAEAFRTIKALINGNIP